MGFFTAQMPFTPALRQGPLLVEDGAGCRMVQAGGSGRMVWCVGFYLLSLCPSPTLLLCVRPSGHVVDRLALGAKLSSAPTPEG